MARTAGAWLAGLGGVLLIAAIATIPMAPRAQAIFAVLCAIGFLLANRVPGRAVTLVLVGLSLTASLRYLFWRATETLDFASTPETVLGLGLALAELYALAGLVLGYVQTAWPLERKPVPLPPDPAQWPSVDVFIPTYNESISVVRGTMLAALALDWPADRLRVWLLDDGRREEFRRFAAEIGCGYLTRPDNRHAKAGNLNHALAVTGGEFVAVFDCDHVPTRAFLQLTMGWLVAEPNMALVQTPHHFYSPDPFQRNLAAGTRVPAEGNMFYGLVQDGNDSWNATFFCGSCAVLRRSALDEIGGVATETVTEDAHTMLKLHRRGWDSAYLRLPLAAGLATERLTRHLGQRIRWARGMIQILRIDNPLFGPGLSLPQRLCYLQASGHFLFAMPRIVFLTAPLAFLLLGQNVIAASPLAITAYALPHIAHAIATNSRIQGRWRHSFWSGIYETVLALHLVRVTLATLVRPRGGRFDVTPKGGLLENGFFDLGAVYPNLILAFLLLAGLTRGIVSLVFFSAPTLVSQALLLNSVWAAVSLLSVLAALAVGRETRQMRVRAQMPARVPVSIHLADGAVLDGMTHTLSQSGGGVTVALPAMLPTATEVDVVFHLASDDLTVPAHVLRWDERGMQLRWEPQTLEEEARMIQAVFGRADAWTSWSAYPSDRPLMSLWRVLVSIRGLFRPRDRSPRPLAMRGRAGVVVLAALLGLSAAAHAESHPAAVRPATVLPATVLPATVLPATVLPATVLPATVRPVPPPEPFLAPAAPGLAASATPLATAPVTGTRTVVLNLRQLGAQGPLALRGTSELQGIEFGVRADEVVTAATLTLSGAMSPALLPEFSNVTVTLNDQFVGTIPANRDQSSFTLDMPVSPVFFQDDNRLNFRFTGRYTPECNDPLSGLLWTTVYDSSTLTLTLERLPPQRDLARLPMPFFDPHEKQTLSLPFVLPPSPGNDTLRAAGIVASWFGNQAAFRGATFPVAAELPSEGNAVMVVVGRDPHPGLPPIDGPTLAVIPSPADPLSTVLVVAGRTGDEAAAAAAALAAGSRGLGGDVAAVQMPELPDRQPYDAPNWIATTRPVRLGELVNAADLQVAGYAGLLHVPFRTAPDFYTWRDRPFDMAVRFHAPPGPIVDVEPSRLDVGINGQFLDSFSLAGSGRGGSWLSGFFDRSAGAATARVAIPAYDVFGFNDLEFYFDAKPLHRGDCVAVPSDLRMSIDPDTTIDLSRGIRFTEMPNLAYFVNSGFPFTRMADLSQTAVILPDRPTPVELGVYLDLMGRIGNLTGTAVSRVVVARPDGAAALAQRDLLLIGTVGHLPLGELLTRGPVRLSSAGLALRLPDALDPVRRLFGDTLLGGGQDDRKRLAATLAPGLPEGTAALIGAESPLAAGRSVVALVAGQPQALATAMALLRDPDQGPRIQGDLSLLAGGRVTSYRVGPGYTVGSLPLWLWPGWALRDQPLGVAALAFVGCVLLGFVVHRGMRRQVARRLATRSTTH